VDVNLISQFYITIVKKYLKAIILLFYLWTIFCLYLYIAPLISQYTSKHIKRSKWHRCTHRLAIVLVIVFNFFLNIFFLQIFYFIINVSWRQCSLFYVIDLFEITVKYKQIQLKYLITPIMGCFFLNKPSAVVLDIVIN